MEKMLARVKTADKQTISSMLNELESLMKKMKHIDLKDPNLESLSEDLSLEELFALLMVCMKIIKGQLA